MSYGFLCSLQVFFYIFAFISFFFYLKMHHSQAQSGLYSISFTHSLFICPTVNSEGSPTAFKQQLPSSLSSHSLASNLWLYGVKALDDPDVIPNPACLLCRRVHNAGNDWAGPEYSPQMAVIQHVIKHMFHQLPTQCLPVMRRINAARRNATSIFLRMKPFGKCGGCNRKGSSVVACPPSEE